MFWFYTLYFVDGVLLVGWLVVCVCLFSQQQCASAPGLTKNQQGVPRRVVGFSKLLDRHYLILQNENHWTVGCYIFSNTDRTTSTFFSL